MKRALAVVALIWCASPAFAEPVTYLDSKFHFSLAHPSDWTVKEPQGNFRYQVTSPESGMTCRVFVNDVPGGNRPDDVIRDTLENRWSDADWQTMLADSHPNMKIRESSVDHLADGWPANTILFRSNDDIGRIVFFRMEHYLMTARNGKIYTADCYERDEAKLEALWERWGAEAGAVIKSFRVTAE